jgi:phosphatidylserine/phosphatidylglycerophosphate/cardiolipin synthase-like enzyme
MAGRRSREGSGGSRRSSRSSGGRFKWPWLLVFLLCLGLLAWGAYTGTGLDDEATPTPFPADAGGGTIGVFVEPDDGRSPILQELEAAERTITLQVYLLSDNEIIEALERAAARGVEVRVLLEEHPFGGSGLNPKAFERLEAADVGVRWGNPVFTFSHVKTIVIDREVAIVMNLNLTVSAFTRNREFGVITTRPAEVAQAAAIFEADWERTEEPPDGPLVVSPTTSRDRLLDLIEGAERSIDVYAEVVRDQEILGAIVAAAERGVAVRLLMSQEDEDDDRGRDERAMLAEAGIDVRFASRLYVHAKIVLVDRVRAYLGSQNFTATSLDQNREIGVILDEPAGIARIAQTFDADFAAGRPAA